jgi:hypothetical protein
VDLFGYSLLYLINHGLFYNSLDVLHGVLSLNIYFCLNLYTRMFIEGSIWIISINFVRYDLL